MVDHEPPVSNEEARLQLAVQTAVQMVEGCDFVCVTLGSGTEVTHRVASDPVAQQADLLQHELGEGPVLDCIRTRQAVVSQDLRSEERWGLWTARTLELDIVSSASLWLHAEDTSYGALTLYSSKPFRFTPAALATAQTLAGRLGLGIAAGRQTDQLNAVGSRTVIGQAQGILMERHGLEAGEALNQLTRAAEESALELAQVAVRLVRTRELPGAPQPR